MLIFVSFNYVIMQIYFYWLYRYADTLAELKIMLHARGVARTRRASFQDIRDLSKRLYNGKGTIEILMKI